MNRFRRASAFRFARPWVWPSAVRLAPPLPCISREQTCRICPGRQGSGGGTETRPEGRAIDVGTGTGVTAVRAIEALDPRSVIVGIDPSLEMLRLAQDKGVLRLVGGQVPGLPFPDSTFDGIMANFVVSHLIDYKTALLDMIRVLRVGGRLGVTAWGAGKSEFARVWEETAEAFIIGVADYLSGREAAEKGRFMCHTLGGAQWQRFRERLAEVFQNRFRNPIEYTNEVLLAVGTKHTPS